MEAEAIPPPANNTCLHQQLEKNSLLSPCFDPLVYTFQRGIHELKILFRLVCH